jgi:3-phenylpropionate/trans-cinnamate dioxygenase ferredoxin subunit
MKLFDLAGKPVLLVRAADGTHHAMRNLCSHQGVDLSAGVLTGRMLSSGVGAYRYVADYEIVRCPRHGYQYDVRMGRALLDPEARVRLYSVVLEGGNVLVEL